MCWTMHHVEITDVALGFACVCTALSLCKVSMTGSSARIPFVKASGEAIRDDVVLCTLWQLERAVHFLHEHPLRAASVVQLRVIFVARCDPCEFRRPVRHERPRLLHGSRRQERWHRSLNRIRRTQGITCMRKWCPGNLKPTERYHPMMGGHHVEYD